MLLTLVFVFPLISEAAKMKIINEWSYAASFTPSLSEEHRLIPGRKFSVPGFSSEIGDLVSEFVSLDGQWEVSLDTSKPLYIVGIGGIAQLHIRDSSRSFADGDMLFVEGVGTTLYEGEIHSHDNGVFTSTGRTGSWLQNFGGEHSFFILADLATPITYDMDGTPIVPTLNAKASGIFTTEYTFELSTAFKNFELITPVFIKDLGGNNLSFLPNIVVPEDYSKIGLVGQIPEIEGEAFVIHTIGSRERIRAGTELYLGDIIETLEGGSATLSFIDGTNFVVGENGRLKIDEYVYDPRESELPEFSPLKGVFKLFGGLIEEMNNSAIMEDMVGGCGGMPCGAAGGIRGDAEEIIRKDLIDNPHPELGEVGLLMETASPVGVSTFVEVPSGSIEFSFSYAFLTSEGRFWVELGGLELFSLTASLENEGFSQSLDIALNTEQSTFLSELSFMFDGEAKNELLIWNVEFNGIKLQNFDLFGRKGHGSVANVFITTPEKLAYLEAEISAVPEPRLVWSISIGLIVLLGWTKLRHRLGSIE